MRYDTLILLADGSAPKAIDATQKFEQKQNGTEAPATNETSTNAQTGTSQTQEATPATAPAPSFFGSPASILIWLVVIVAYFYFIVNGQKKKDKKVKDMQNSIKTGDDVYTSAGFYGKVVDVEEKTFIIEFGLNKGVRIPVRKSDVYPATVTSKDIEDKTK